MKVVARVHLFPPDHCAGAERMLEELLVPLQDRGHQVDVYLARGRTGPGYDYRNLRVHRRGSDWLTAASDADVLITHLDQTSEVVGVASVLNKPVVQVLHNTHAPTKMWANCKADLLVFNSEWMKADFGMDGIVVRPPVWAKDYAPHRLDRIHRTFVTLVNTTQDKGGLIFYMLAARNPAVDFMAIEGAYGEQLDFDLPNVHRRAHATTDMRRIYNYTKILLMPSKYESWGRVGVEAMASGIPVVATPTPGLLESLDYAGWFVDYDDFAGWEEAILQLLGSSEAYTKASERSSKRSAELDPTDDINRWINAVERL